MLPLLNTPLMDNQKLIPESRAVRRRRERELAKRGIGLGWRYTVSKRRKYPVKEPPYRSLEYLENESDLVQERMNINII